MNCRPSAGSIVLVDWRTGASPQESSKIRPAVVVEDDALFPDGYPNVIVVPLTREPRLAYPAFAEPIEPTLENGCDSFSWALAHNVTAVSMSRVQRTASRINDKQLQTLRRRIALALGM